MLNSGAIMSSALLSAMIEPKMKTSEKFDYTLQYMKVSIIRRNRYKISPIEKHPKSPRRATQKTIFSTFLRGGERVGEGGGKKSKKKF